MDVEDWYHLDYFDRSACDTSASSLDGLDVYADLIAQQAVPSSFFVLGELAAALRQPLTALAAAGHDIGSHGGGHVRPLTMTPAAFAGDVRRAKDVLEDVLGRAATGYRAPCFSLDRARLDVLRECGHLYDSSRIDFRHHRLYGTLDMTGYARVSPNVYRDGSFFEFEVSTLDIAGRTLPVAGGGYIRILPWWLMHRLIDRYLRDNALYVLYIHPFELSRRGTPVEPPGASLATRLRYRAGRSSVADRLRELIDLLRARGFSFTTFSALRNELLSAA
jgi:polysaccharide deacetylase family protein (PEP-CTERM system associated)